jgi:hypothetical protein
MNRLAKVERTFFLGQFKNIKITDEIEDIPEYLALNEEVINNIYYMLLLSVESQYRRYQKINKELGEISLEDSLALLEEMKGSTMKSIKELISSNMANEKPTGEIK